MLYIFLCATASCSPNTRVGVVGLGGLGHMAAKFGIAFGCHTTVISRGTGKKDSALNDLKVHAFVNSTDPEEMKVPATDCVCSDVH